MQKQQQQKRKFYTSYACRLWGLYSLSSLPNFHFPNDRLDFSWFPYIFIKVQSLREKLLHGTAWSVAFRPSFATETWHAPVPLFSYLDMKIGAVTLH